MGGLLATNTTLAALVLTCALGPLQASALGQSVGTSAGDASTGAIHSTRGVVKSIDAMVLVLTRSRQRAELTLALTPSVHREGTIAPGATVSVRYRDVGGEHLAIAIAVTRSREPAGDGDQK